MSIVISYLDDPPGSRKSDESLTDIASNPGFYIIAVPTTDLMAQHVNRLQTKMMELGRSIRVRPLSYKDRAGALTVNAAIHEEMSLISWSPIRHAVILISHQSLSTMDWSRPELAAHHWNLIVDEALEAWSFISTSFEVSHDYLTRIIQAEPILDDKGRPTKWADLSLTPYGRELALSGQDHIKDSLPILDLLADNRRAMGNLSFFTEGVEDKKERRLHLGSALLPQTVAPFASVRFLAAGFRHSLVFKVWSTMPDVEFRHQPLRNPSPPPAKPLGQRVRIHWFSPRAASKRLFATEEEVLKLAADYVNTKLEQPFYYVLNNEEKCKPARYSSLITNENGTRIPAKCHGSNKERDYRAAVWLSALKPSKNECALLELAYGISRDEVDRAREHESIYQWATRSNVRVPESTAMVDLYVFDEFQAKALGQLMGAEDIRSIDVGISPTSAKEEEPRMGKARGGRPKKYLTQEEAATAKKKSDKARYERKKGGASTVLANAA